MRSKLDFAVCGIGADAISFLVAAIVEAGIGDGPFAWVGHVGEKWSLTLAQHGHINQWLACDSVRGRWFGLLFPAGVNARSRADLPCRPLFSRARASRSIAASQ